ncbi:hypothetical protein M0Q28_00735 [Patescibacteria group bacterium]|jgi:hypothetical protein|nr:hypothetical protein [Patescibacteria group bacterium]
MTDDPSKRFIDYLDQLHLKTNDDRLVEPKVRSSILTKIDEACKITSLEYDDLLQRLDFRPKDLTIEALEAFLAELRAIFWLRDFGFIDIMPLKALKKVPRPDFYAKYKDKSSTVEVFCLTETHEQQRDSALKVYVNFNPGFKESKFERDFISKAASKKVQLDSGQSELKIMLCVINSNPIIRLNTKKEMEGYAEYLYKMLNWGKNYHVGLLTGLKDDVIFPALM